MNINLYRCPNKHKTQVRNAIECYANALISKQIQKHCTITINFENLNYSGLVNIDEYNTKNKPRGFVIDVNRNEDIADVLVTLAHEMVHVKQYIEGEIDDNLKSWRGNEVDREAVNYDELPGEKEAYEREYILYNNFMNRNKNEN